MPDGVGIPTARGLTNSLGDYGMGLVSGLAYRLVSGITGSGLIGGAIAAAGTGAIVRGEAGKIIAISLGFQAGQQGLGSLPGLGGGAPGQGGLFGGLFGGTSAPAQEPGLRVI